MTTEPEQLRCLVADGSRMVRRVAGRILRDLDLKVTEAATGREALDQCRLSLPDAILLEARFADMDGLAVLGEVRAMARESNAVQPKIIICTAERAPRDILCALQAGADEYVMKPFDSDIIASKLAIAGVTAARMQTAA